MGDLVDRWLLASGCDHARRQRIGERRAEQDDDGMAPHVPRDLRYAKAAGKVRMEGKDYVMADGDVVEFRFNV